ncbi:amidase [Streptomyces sp. NPDC098789]|uniref:amidase n=1 Tax=Streptomyces sp. NPDC098789 TaxID=3366098 RepID=UPI003828AE91
MSGAPTVESEPTVLQRFTLVHSPVDDFPGFGDARYDGVKADPPQGCVPEDVGGYFGLRCERPGGRLLDAVAETCGEIRGRYGLLMADLGIEKLWEWSADGADGWGAEIVGQLLLMAAERGAKVGYDTDDLVRFLRAATGEAGSDGRSGLDELIADCEAVNGPADPQAVAAKRARLAGPVLPERPHP